jgi:mannose-1-phosphate guanylyltransferase
MNKSITPLILCGGSGTRLWPLSTPEKPKQFLALTSRLSLLQETILRLHGLKNANEPLVICSKKHHELVREQFKKIGKKAREIFLEPVGRNTAPAIAIAALYEEAHGRDPIFFVLAADSAIRDKEKFYRAVNNAIPYAQDNRVVVFGVPPLRPETGYGYIKWSKKLDKNAVVEVERFVEKPNLAKAKKYLASGKYYWNSGMFMFKASVFLRELKKFAPDIFSSCKKVVSKTVNKNRAILLPEREFSCCPADSIDYAVMEKTRLGVMVPLDAGWSDIGSWLSLWEFSQKDCNGNVVVGGKVNLQSSENSYIYSDKKNIAALGVKDMIIVDAEDTILVVHKDECQSIKRLTEKKD